MASAHWRCRFGRRPRRCSHQVAIQTGVAALGIIASPIAAMVSAYFGIQYSQRAATEAAETKKDAERRVEKVEEDKAKTVESIREEVLPASRTPPKGSRCQEIRPRASPPESGTTSAPKQADGTVRHSGTGPPASTAQRRRISPAAGL
jgi:hypothetical protein